LTPAEKVLHYCSIGRPRTPELLVGSPFLELEERGPFLLCAVTGPRKSPGAFVVLGGHSLTTLSVVVGAAVSELPIWLAVLGAVAVMAIVVLCAGVAVAALNRAERADVAETLLGLSYVISALSGLLPWGRPSSPPALPGRPAPNPCSSPEPAEQEGSAGLDDLRVDPEPPPAGRPRRPMLPCPGGAGPTTLSSAVRRDHRGTTSHRRLLR
jgi:hypothetical protein